MEKDLLGGQNEGHVAKEPPGHCWQEVCAKGMRSPGQNRTHWHPCIGMCRPQLCKVSLYPEDLAFVSRLEFHPLAPDL